MTSRVYQALAYTLFLTATPAFAASHGSSHHSGGSHSSGHGHSSGSHSSSHTSAKSHTSSHGKSSSTSHPTHTTTTTTHAAHRADRCTNCDRDEHGRILRSKEAKSAFMKATGYPHGRHGYVIDHITPLACGGADTPNNMQWQTAAAAKAKDTVERKGCR